MSDGPVEGVPAQPYAPVRGQVGNTRSIPLSILWAILTIGIYTYVWTFRTQEEMKKYTGDGMGGWLGLVVYLVFSPITYFVIPSEIKTMYVRDGRPEPITAWWGLWFLLPIIGSLIWFIKVQGLLNDFWTSKGAPPPGS
jgi:hypothetical protein